MIAFLAWVTLVYSLVLVLVLAVSLITILAYLWSIGTTLAKIRDGLLVVRDQTAPLGSQVDAINGALGTVAVGFSGALDDLGAVDGALGGLLGESAPAAAAA